MSKILAVAWREFKHTAFTKAFIIGGVALPIIIWALIPVVAMLTHDVTPPLTGTVAIIDPTGKVSEAAAYQFDPVRIRENIESAGEFAQELSEETDLGAMSEKAKQNSQAAEMLAMDSFPIDITIAPFTDHAQLETIKAGVRDGSYVAAAVIDPRLLQPREAAESGDEDEAPRPVVELFSTPSIKPDHAKLIKRKLGDAVVLARTRAAGEDIEQLNALLRRPTVQSRSLIEGGGEEKDTSEFKQLLPVAFMILLWVSAFTSGNYLLTTTIEEKSNKVMEVLLSAVSPLQLMTGKIIGQGCVGLVMLAMYGGLLIAGLLTFAASILDWMPTVWLLYFALYFIMAFFLIATFMASIGSAVNDLHEAQTLMAPAMMILILPLILMMPAIKDPNGPIATISSFIPPLTPFIMVARLPSGEIPFWQIPATLVIGFVAVAIGLWACAKIFRIGVLMTGKPPSPIELLKWLRYG